MTEQHLDRLMERSRHLRDTLALALAHNNQLGSVSGTQMMRAVITPTTVNDAHGTGVLLRRAFNEDRDIFCLRSSNYMHGERQSFGRYQHLVSHYGLSRKESLERVRAVISGVRIEQILAVPYYRDDYINTVTLQEISGAPLCTYIMDDTNVEYSLVEDELVKEVLERSRLRLAISPQMKTAYENKFGCKFWLAPPATAPAELLRVRPPAQAQHERTRGALLGNVWSPEWLALLRQCLRGSGITIDWYGAKSSNLDHFTQEELAADGLRFQGWIESEKDLVDALAPYQFAVVASGTGNEVESHRSIAMLSLPSKISFIMSTTRVPIIVLGHESTAAADFVRRLGVGTSCPYETARLKEAVEFVTNPRQQAACRARAQAVALNLSSAGLGEFLWRSLRAGKPIDDRFEQIARLIEQAQDHGNGNDTVTKQSAEERTC